MVFMFLIKLISFSLFCIAIGYFLIKHPNTVWEIRENWTTNDGTEPSDLYILIMRIVGVLFILVGLLGILTWIFEW
jgi:O-antigen/teichoic acid export membrane protein